MNIFLILLIAVFITLFFLYKKAKRKQSELRAKARSHYEDIKLTIEYWLKDKANVERTKLAKISQTLFDDYRKRATFMPFQDTKPEEFEYLDEWRLIIGEIEAANSNWISDPIRGEVTLDFRVALVELRDINLEDIK
jgi:hypothetical protein